MTDKNARTVPLADVIRAIDELRYQADLSWWQLAEAIGIKKDTLFAIVKYGVQPRDRSERKLRAFYDLSERERDLRVRKAKGAAAA
jgi:ribosome-binding protein aMBF1 (putative translation factor)